VGRFSRGSRQDHGGDEFLARLPAAFTLTDLLASVPDDAVNRTLSWLYAAIQRGEIVPNVDDFPIVYQVTGRKPGPRDPAAA
jgi:hypothetical protein